MLTPRFELQQDDEEVTVVIYALYANIKDTEVYVEGNDFRFYSSPYYLRLQLPGEIVETDSSEGSYDCDTGKFILKFSKVTPGQHFENLDMITTLLAPPKKQKGISPMIEVIGNPTAQHDGVDPLLEETDQGDDDDWFIPQTAVTPGVSENLTGQQKYGFGNKISGALRSFCSHWLKDVVDLPHPDSTPSTDRQILREAAEKFDFSDDHYMADLVHFQDTIGPIMMFKPKWYDSSDAILTDGEKDMLKELPNKEHLLDDGEKQVVVYGLVDILFASCYDHRVTLGENTSESGWTINKLSGTLSWFQTYSTLGDVLRTSVRRSLCYPLYRHWDLAMKVLEDVQEILKRGKMTILKRLCDVHHVFIHSFEPRYLLNSLYITDYLIWIQRAPDSLILTLAEALDGIILRKEDMGLDLVELETAVRLVQEEEKGVGNGDDVPEERNLIIGNSIHDVVEELDRIHLGVGESGGDDSDTDSDDTSSGSTSTWTSCSWPSDTSNLSSDGSSGTSEGSRGTNEGFRGTSEEYSRTSDGSRGTSEGSRGTSDGSSGTSGPLIVEINSDDSSDADF
ncbi:protein SHQ1 homolog [Diachasmimorpha longicaudata]|uniref:protein SHQ1 homolog n=1 Tax=Diachasmimorpha longicaudata TaxID=58733 RepID=UPI0030B89EA5